MGIITNPQQYEAINEVYFGQTPGIMRCFDAFSAWRQKYVTDSKFFMLSNGAETDPLLLKFEREVEREFNIASFSFVIENNDMANMCTLIPYFKGNDQKKDLVVRKDGYKFSDSNQAVLITIAPTGLVLNSEFTDREAFAIFLHEVGHNFQTLINTGMNSLETVKSGLLIYGLLTEALIDQLSFLKDVFSLAVFNKNSMRQISSCYNSIAETEDGRSFLKYLGVIYGVIKGIKNISLNVLLIALRPIVGIMSGLQSLLKLINPVSWIFNTSAYRGEQMADKFASYYGFGEDLYSALAKFDTNSLNTSISYYFNKIPLVSHFYQALCIPAQILSDITDCHPGNATRMKGIVDSLEHDLNDPRIDPKAKKLIKKDLDDIKQTEKEIFENNQKINNPYLVKWWYNNFIYHVCGGDLKYSLSKGLFKDLDDTNKTYERLKDDSSIKNTKIK